MPRRWKMFPCCILITEAWLITWRINVLLTSILSPQPTPVSGMSGAFLRSIRSAVVRRGAEKSTSGSGPGLYFTRPLFLPVLMCQDA